MTLDEHSKQTTVPDLTAAINQLWTRFLPEIRQRAALLETAAQAFMADSMTQELRQNASAAAHKLAGTLGTFNLARGTELAREFEQACASEESCREAGAARLAAVAAEIRSIIDGRR